MDDFSKILRCYTLQVVEHAHSYEPKDGLCNLQMKVLKRQEQRPLNFTIKCWEDLHVGLPQHGQRLLVDVNGGQMRDEIIAHQETHHNPIIYDIL